MPDRAVAADEVQQVLRQLYSDPFTRCLRQDGLLKVLCQGSSAATRSVWPISSRPRRVVSRQADARDHSRAVIETHLGCLRSVSSLSGLEKPKSKPLALAPSSHSHRIATRAYKSFGEQYLLQEVLVELADSRLPAGFVRMAGSAAQPVVQSDIVLAVPSPPDLLIEVLYPSG